MMKVIAYAAACLLAVLGLFLLGAVTARAGDWPQWQGPDRNNISKETGLLKTWPPEGPKLLWTFEKAGVGFSGPAVVGDRLYTMGGRDDTSYVFALDAKTGKELWACPIGKVFTNGWGDGPHSTPTVDRDLLYALDATGELICVETASGKKRWFVNLQKDLGGEMMSGWGYSESPLVDGDQLVCCPGGEQGTMAALDKKTGQVRWRSKELKDKATYASLVVAEFGGVRQYVQLTYKGSEGGGIVGVAAKDGQLLWYHPRPGFQTAVIPTPIVHGDMAYATAGYGAGCDLLQISRTGDKFQAKQLYTKNSQKNVMKNTHGGVVLVGDYIYGYSDGAGWTCQKLKTGERVWDDKVKVERGSLTCADGHLYCYAESTGEASLVEPSPDSLKLKSKFKIPRETRLPRKEGRIWTHPVVANGCLYLRDQDLIFCFDVRGHTAAAR
jgi:outer membrane protein assembly factor BamB